MLYIELPESLLNHLITFMVMKKQH